jgi:hypothetical protein
VLFEQQGRDQKAAEREEDVDTEEAPVDQSGMLDHDGEHSDGAEPVEGRPITKIEGLGTPRHSGD